MSNTEAMEDEKGEDIEGLHCGPVGKHYTMRESRSLETETAAKCSAGADQYRSSRASRVESIIECGYVDGSNGHQFECYSPFFEYSVEVFTAEEDLERRLLYRPSDVARKIDFGISRIGTFLNQKKYQIDGIFQASGFRHKRGGSSGLKLGAYFITEDMCRCIQDHFAASIRKKRFKESLELQRHEKLLQSHHYQPQPMPHLPQPRYFGAPRAPPPYDVPAAPNQFPHQTTGYGPMYHQSYEAPPMARCAAFYIDDVGNPIAPAPFDVQIAIMNAYNMQIFHRSPQESPQHDHGTKAEPRRNNTEDR